MSNPIGQFIKGYNTVKQEQQAKKADKTTIKVVMPDNKGDQNRESLKTGIKAIGKGLAMAGKSLATPSTSKRPKIAQMPGRRSEMDIVRNADVNSLKAEGLQGTDIRGKQVEVRSTNQVLGRAEQLRLVGKANQVFGAGWRQYFKKDNGEVDWAGLKFRLENR
jgi:hypothetical protein